MSDPRETGQVWQPANDFEESLSKSLRRLSMAKAGYEVGRSLLTEDEQISYEVAQRDLKTDVGKVIKFKESASFGEKDLLPGIGLVQDGIHAVVVVPSMSQYHPTMDILVPIEELDEKSQRALPPISEEAVVRGLEEAGEKIKTRGYAYRHELGDDSWEKLQKAIRDMNKRVLVVIRAKRDGHLLGIRISLSDNGEKVTLTLPPGNSRTEPLPVEARLKALETQDPKIRDYLSFSTAL